MRNLPLGYRIVNGQAVIDKPAARQVQSLYQNYLSGLSLTEAAKQAGITASHGTVKKILLNRHYLGDNFYPAFIDQKTYDSVTEELAHRSAALGRNNRPKGRSIKPIPTDFVLKPVKSDGLKPIEQAEYLYSLIEEVSQHGKKR